MNRLKAIVGASLLLLGSGLAAQQPNREQRPPEASPPAQTAPPRPFPDRPPYLGPHRRPDRFPGGPPPWMGPEAGPRRRWSGAHFPALLFELAEKSPEEQERMLQANPRFRRMPPEAQQRLRERLKRISAMTPEERQRFRERFETFHRLPLEARDKIREEVFPKWSQLPPERRRALMKEFRALRAIPAAEQEQRLTSQDFNKQFNSEEQQLLRLLLSFTSLPVDTENKP